MQFELRKQRQHLRQPKRQLAWWWWNEFTLSNKLESAGQWCAGINFDELLLRINYEFNNKFICNFQQWRRRPFMVQTHSQNQLFLCNRRKFVLCLCSRNSHMFCD